MRQHLHRDPDEEMERAIRVGYLGEERSRRREELGERPQGEKMQVSQDLQACQGFWSLL